MDYERLNKYLNDNHGLNLDKSEMNSLIREVNNLQTGLKRMTAVQVRAALSAFIAYHTCLTIEEFEEVYGVTMTIVDLGYQVDAYFAWDCVSEDSIKNVDESHFLTYLEWVWKLIQERK